MLAAFFREGTPISEAGKTGWVKRTKVFLKNWLTFHPYKYMSISGLHTYNNITATKTRSTSQPFPMLVAPQIRKHAKRDPGLLHETVKARSTSFLPSLDLQADPHIILWSYWRNGGSVRNWLKQLLKSPKYCTMCDLLYDNIMNWSILNLHEFTCELTDLAMTSTSGLYCCLSKSMCSVKYIIKSCKLIMSWNNMTIWNVNIIQYHAHNYHWVPKFSALLNE